MSDFGKFKKAVFLFYVNRKANHDIHIKLEYPSPGNLRDFCLLKLQAGISTEDNLIFSEFFNPSHQYPTLKRAIEKVDLGKLKPLQNFMIEKTQRPDELIIKLLAILIDFEPRPFNTWKQLSHMESSKACIPEDINEIPKLPHTQMPMPGNSKIAWKKPFWLSIVLLLFLVAFQYTQQMFRLKQGGNTCIRIHWAIVKEYHEPKKEQDNKEYPFKKNA